MTYGIKTQGGSGDDTGTWQQRTPPKTKGGGSSNDATIPAPQPIDAQLIADVLKGGNLSTADAETIQRFYSACLGVATGLGLAWPSLSGIDRLTAISTIRAEVLNAFSRASQVAVEAASDGFLLPDDPLPRFSSLNAVRQLFDPIAVSAEESSALLSSSIDLVRVAAARDAGTVSFEHHLPALQLASFEVSLDGISKRSGDPLIDILGYQPDADFIKRKQALDSLARLDFSKRKPYLLFTADLITGGKRQSGTIVCWMKMRDASGYRISKRDVITAVEFAPATISANDVQVSTNRLLATPTFNQLLSFYDWLTVDDVAAFVDPSGQPGTLYSYCIAGVQETLPANSSFFDVPMSSLYLGTSQMDSVRSIIASDVSSSGLSGSIDSVSPYPALAQVVYGDSGYGWILAGCNMLGSRRRGDTDDETRSYSYIGSHATSILTSVSSGRMFVPNDASSIHSAIDSGISSFGIAQTILGILDGTGVTLFAARKDDPLGFQPTQQSLEGVSRGLSRILSVIDPESAILDPHALAVSLSTSTTSAQQVRYSSTPINGTGQSSIPDGVTLDAALGSDVMDLTTYSGISRLMQAIRTIYDFYPGALV